MPRLIPTRRARFWIASARVKFGLGRCSRDAQQDIRRHHITRDEGVALRYLEIDGNWEDHIRYAITAEDWQERGDELSHEWLGL